MQTRRETNIPSAFTVDTIINVHSVVMTPYCLTHENPPVVFDFWQLLYIDRGQYTCSIDGDLFCLTEGQLLLCEPGGTRYVVSQEDAVTAFISFRCTSEKMAAFGNRIVALTEEERSLLSRVLSIGLEKFVEVPEGQPFYGQQTADGTTDYELQTMKNTLELLLIELSESVRTRKTQIVSQNQANYYSRQFQTIKAFMEQRLCQSLTVSDITAYTGLSAATIKRIFFRCTGMGAVHYFQTLRMKEAKRLIRKSDRNITQIAEALGFSSIHHFSRVFKKTTGMSPREYARSVLPN